MTRFLNILSFAGTMLFLAGSLYCLLAVILK